MIRNLASAWVVLGSLLVGTGRPADADLAAGFVDPPDAARPWCYWWWLNGAASREGITRDFEQMQKQGIAGALLFDAGMAGDDAPRGPEFMSPAWRELYRHALREAARCRIVLGVNLCSGWNAGGPWVTPETAAKRIVATATTVSGPGRVQVALKRPPAVQDFYREIAVLAAPRSRGDVPDLTLTASSTYKEFGPQLAQDGEEDTRWVSNGSRPGMGPTPAKPEWLEFDADQPWPAAGLYLLPFHDCGPKDIEIQASDDGKTYRTLARATVQQHTPLTLPLDEARARHFRVLFLSSWPYHDQADWNVQVAEIALLTRAQLQAGHRAHGGDWDRQRTIDLSRALDAEGRLDWDVPPGTWNVLRIGYTLHARSIKCVGSGPGGLEIDTMIAAAMEQHFAQTGAKLAADAGPLAGTTLQYFHIDSWELGQPTWTPRMREEFQARRGYDPLPYLPALLGHTVDGPQITERFLHDYRRTAADLVAANYYGRLRELTVKCGLVGTHPESGGPMFTHWIDALECEGINDVPMGEFWKRNYEPDGPITHLGNPSLKQAANAAHVYGKPVCQAEAFTSFGCDWLDDPWSMKDIGDYAFCTGLTRNVLCFWIHQPQLDARPGFQWAHVGTHFDCHLTWWDMSHAWLAYLTRCQYLLRQGRFVADFAYFPGEQVPGFLPEDGKLQPARPDGFDYDAINLQVLLQRTAVRDGRLTLPDGMSYRYLVLPHAAGWTASPAALAKLCELVEGGATAIGPPPASAPGLSDYPHCDQAVQGLANRLWGAAPGPAGQRRVGRGRVIWGRELNDVVQDDHLPPDIEFRHAPAGAHLDWIHRRTDKLDLYFVSNQAAEPVEVEAVFRTAGRTPSLWDAVTGQIRALPVWREEPGRSVVPLALAPREAYFLVFGHPAGPPGTVSFVAPNGKSNFPATSVVEELAGPWQVQFGTNPDRGTLVAEKEPVTFERLVSWTERPEPAIKYFSGTATYRFKFPSPSGRAARSVPSPDQPSVGARRGQGEGNEPHGPSPAQRLYLDLGQVKNLAHVKLNGRDLGTVWTAPWRVEISGALQPADNELEIEVVNLWPNRLIGDAQLPPEQRTTRTNVKTYENPQPSDRARVPGNCAVCTARRTAGQPAALLPSGLLGPVTIRTVPSE